MDQRLYEAIIKNDIAGFKSLVQENEDILEQKTTETMDSALHLAARFERFELVKEIVKLHPTMVGAQNKNLETPLHEACYKGDFVILDTLLENDRWAALKRNHENQSPLFVACASGHRSLASLLLNQPWLLDLERDGIDLTSLQVAASRGHTEIFKEILDLRPEFAYKTDKIGYSSLHYSCSRGYLEITKMLLSYDQNLAVQYDNYGYTPLHLAAMNGQAGSIEAFVSMAPTSFQVLTKEGETVFHLAVRHNQYGAFKCLAQVFNGTDLIKRPDNNGNAIIHLAAFGKRHQILRYSIDKALVDVNIQNNKELTALDILDQADRNVETTFLENLLVKAGGKRGTELIPHSLNVNDIQSHPASHEGSPRHVGDQDDEVDRQSIEELPSINGQGSKRLRLISLRRSKRSSEISNGSSFDLDLFPRKAHRTMKRSETKLNRHKQLNKKQEEDITELFKGHYTKQEEIYREALQNARNTIILVAVLIATVTFTAGINPPGGVYQDGPLKGKSTVGRTTAFKVFSVSNNIALFTSLCIVNVLVSIIPYERKPLMRLLEYSHKVMWVAVSFMATAFVAGSRVIMPRPHGKGTEWMFASLLAITAGTLGVVLVGLVMLLIRHWLRKLNVRKERRRKLEGSTKREQVGWWDSFNSNIESSRDLGYHSF